MDIDTFKREFKRTKINNTKYKLFKNVFTNTPTYQDFIDYIEWSKKYGQYRSDTEGLYILHISDFENEISHMGEYSNFISTIREIYEELNDTDHMGATVVIAEYNKNEKNITGIPKHTDQTDTVHWACTGSSKWEIFDGDKVETIFVEPGDIFYTKMDTIHQVETIERRGAIILSVGKWSENFDPNKRY